MKKLSVLLGATLSLISTSNFAAGRDHIEIVGSSTVYPFATVVAERINEFKEPTISI